MSYIGSSAETLKAELAKQQFRYAEYLKQGLKLDMTRGKPCAEQLKLSEPMLDISYLGDFSGEDGTDCRNYGLPAGLPEARKLMGEIMGATGEQVICGGNSSLNMMYDILMMYMVFGTGDIDAEGRKTRPWSQVEGRRFICPVPGYDRHFAITELLGFELIPVELTPEGPDIDRIRELVRNPKVLGMWSVPKYSNPTGYVYSDESVKALAELDCAAPDFRIMWDDAYTVHFLGESPLGQLNLLSACTDAGCPDRALLFASTSKITFPGAGLAAVAASPKNISYILARIKKQTIGPDKLNQLRHVKFLKNRENILALMAQHSEILRPKFQRVIDIFRKEFEGEDICSWTEPDGGYFISFNTLPGLAADVVKMCADCGVAVTPAGSTYPYGKDPSDRNIRIAPSFPSLEQISKAIEILCICVKIKTLEKLLESAV